MHPVDYYNLNGDFIAIFSGNKQFKIKSENEVQIKLESQYADYAFNQRNGLITIHRQIDKIKLDPISTKFMVLSAIMFDGNHEHAESYVLYEIMKCDVPYIRVGVDYFKLFNKKSRYGYDLQTLKPTNKQTIIDDHGKDFIQSIPKFDDFTIDPSNTQYSRTSNGCYNQYSPFPHKPDEAENIQVDQFPATSTMLCHIFGEDQVLLALKYMQCLYLYPKQPLPILCLVSEDRGTGKTTFLNWISMLFGNNTALISPSILASDFNSSYSDKNIIMIDETTIEKASVIERLKALVTQKEILVNQKFVSNYAIPFYGKVILCTNKEEDFLKVEEKEIRFWVRKVPVIKDLNTMVELELSKEIPLFLKFLHELPPIDFSKSRMIFTSDEIKTEQLEVLKEESKSGLHKDLDYLFEDFFMNNPKINEFKATPLDIKVRFFPNNNQISLHYLSKVLRSEMKLTSKMCRYYPFSDEELMQKTGNAFTIKSQMIDNELSNL